MQIPICLHVDMIQVHPRLIENLIDMLVIQAVDDSLPSLRFFTIKWLFKIRKWDEVAG